MGDSSGSQDGTRIRKRADVKRGAWVSLTLIALSIAVVVIGIVVSDTTGGLVNTDLNLTPWYAAEPFQDRSYAAAQDQVYIGMEGNDREQALFVGPVAVGGSDGKGSLKGYADHLQLSVTDGLAYFVGTRPYGTASGGGASSEGALQFPSIMIMQAKVDVGGDPNGARFFLLRQGAFARIYVHKSSNIADRKRLLEHHYIDVKSDGTLYEPKKISDDSTIEAFVRGIVTRASGAGLDTPSKYETN